MTPIFVLYVTLFLSSLVTFLYALGAYYECPNTRSHKPYIFPIFVSAGWILLAIQGLTGVKPDMHSLLGLAIGTLVALAILLYHYRRQRQECPHHVS